MMHRFLYQCVSKKNYHSAVVTEPIHAANNHVVNHRTPANKDTENSKEFSHPSQMEKFWWLRKRLFQSIQPFQVRMMPLRAWRHLPLKHKLKSPRNLLHQWYAHIKASYKYYNHWTRLNVLIHIDIFHVYDLNKSNSPFNVILRVPPVKTCRTITGHCSVETAPNGNSTMDKSNNNGGFYYISCTSVDSYLVWFGSYACIHLFLPCCLF